MPIKYRNNGQVNTVLDNENIWDLIYPVGTLYWTMYNADDISEILKVPSKIKWEWEKVSGFVYALTNEDPAIMAINKDRLDKNKITKGGDRNNYSGIKLDIDNLPEHAHLINHTHTRGSMNITGDLSAQVGETNQTKSGAFSHNGESTHCNSGVSGETYSNGIHFDASKTWDGETSDAIVKDSTSAISGKTGLNIPYDWLPPFTAAYCWRRIK